MQLLTALAATALLGLTSAQNYGDNTSVSNVTSSACPTGNGVHIIVARASLEAVGYGVIGYVKDQVISRIPGSNAEFVNYPATLNDYINSESDGVLADRALITAFAAKCPKSLIVTMGYSQGAQVTLDSLVGQVVNGFPTNSSINTPLSDSILARTAAVIVMGDPSALYNQSFHVGNANKNSIFPRFDTANFAATGLASRVQSYCDFGDPYCAAGGNLTVHLGYVQEYGAQAVDFVVKQVAKLQGNTTYPTNGTAGTNSTGTAKPSGTGAGATGTVKPTGTGAPKTTANGVPTSSPSITPYKGAAAVAGAPYVLGTLGVALLAGLML